MSILSRRVGVQHLAAIEDAVQFALMSALEVWTRTGPPQAPSAWLFRVAHNQVLGELRQRSRRAQLLEQEGAREPEASETIPEVQLSAEVRDDLLRMLFVCCDEALPVESQMVLALKTLCGFDIREIALRLFTTEANVYKRLARARARLQEHPSNLGDLELGQLAPRLPAVQKILYTLFTEGHLSSSSDEAIRRELCEEAIRLAEILADHPAGQTTETFALLALMHLHTARMPARQDGAGGLLLLEEQDRSRWNGEAIRVGLQWLARSAEGDRFSRYHAEAGIAAEHCLAPSFEETRWDRVVSCYALLATVAPSPVHVMNHAVALAEWKGPAAGLALLEGFAPPSWLAGSHLWAATQADLNRRCGNHEAAVRHGSLALKLAPTVAVRTLLSRRLGFRAST